MKRILPILLSLGLIFGIVAISGCTDNYSGNASSNKESAPGEKLVGTYKISSSSNDAVFGEQKILVQLPANTNNVRVVYNLKGESNYGSGSNGNLGITSETVTKDSGRDPLSLSTDSQYLEAGAGKKINGQLTFDGGKTFFYVGNFVSGNLTVYAS